MEENKEVVEEVKVEEATPVVEDTKPALMAFIFAMIALCLCEYPVVGAIFGFIALSKLKKCGVITKNPYKVFMRIAKPAAIVAIVVSFIMVPLWIVVGAIYGLGIIASIIGGAADATAAIATLFCL